MHSLQQTYFALTAQEVAITTMFFRVQMTVVRRDVDICGQFQQDDLDHRELRLDNQLGAVREFAVDQRGRQQGGTRSPVLSQFLTATEADQAGVAANRGADTNEGPSDDDDDYEEADRDGDDDVRLHAPACTCVVSLAHHGSMSTVLTGSMNVCICRGLLPVHVLLGFRFHT